MNTEITSTPEWAQVLSIFLFMGQIGTMAYYFSAVRTETEYTQGGYTPKYNKIQKRIIAFFCGPLTWTAIVFANVGTYLLGVGEAVVDYFGDEAIAERAQALPEKQHKRREELLREFDRLTKQMDQDRRDRDEG